jgi:hypothetical protein
MREDKFISVFDLPPQTMRIRAVGLATSQPYYYSVLDVTEPDEWILN